MIFLNYTSIADVGKSIVELLQQKLVPEPIKKAEKIALCSPSNKGDLELTLYLYNIEQSGNTRMNSMVTLPNGDMKNPPVPLSLYYLITAYSNSQLSSKAYDEHKMMGRTIQVLNDNSILEGELLKGNLKGTNQKINLEMKNLTYDEMMRIWNFKDVPYSLSIVYKVTPVYIESTKTRKVKRVVETRFNINNINE